MCIISLIKSYLKIIANFRMNIDDILEIYGQKFDKATHGGITILRAAMDIFRYLDGNDK